MSNDAHLTKNSDFGTRKGFSPDNCRSHIGVSFQKKWIALYVLLLLCYFTSTVAVW